MEGFTLSLALLDFVPVAAFGVAVVIVAVAFNSPLFLAGAIISLAAGMCKVLWKLILGSSGKDVKWLNKGFVPAQSAGFLLMLVAAVLNIKRINFAVLGAAVTGMPQLVFFIAWAGLLSAMVWYKKNRFECYSARANWTAEIINSVGQCSLLAAVLFAVN